jgi:hypothetical protein
MGRVRVAPPPPPPPINRACAHPPAPQAPVLAGAQNRRTGLLCGRRESVFSGGGTPTGSAMSGMTEIPPHLLPIAQGGQPAKLTSYGPACPTGLPPAAPAPTPPPPAPAAPKKGRHPSGCGGTHILITHPTLPHPSPPHPTPPQRVQLSTIFPPTHPPHPTPPHPKPYDQLTKPNQLTKTNQLRWFPPRTPPLGPRRRAEAPIAVAH